MENTIKVLRVEPGKTPFSIEIENTLESLQTQVNGYIEALYPYDDPVCLICNEGDKINLMELNRALKDDDGTVYDIIAGSFLIVGVTGDAFCGLTDDLITKYTEIFKYPEIFARIDGKIHVLPVSIAR